MVTLTVKRGDTWEFIAKWRDGYGTAIDLAGSTVRQFLYLSTALSAKSSRAGGASPYVGTPILEMSTETGELTLVEDINQNPGLLCNVRTYIEFSDMEAIPVGSYKFDQEVTFPNGRRLSTETVKLSIVQDETQ